MEEQRIDRIMSAFFYKHVSRLYLRSLPISLIAILVTSVIPMITYNGYEQVLAQVEEEEEEDEGTDSFVANGLIDSIIYTTSGKWIANGKWNMTVSEGGLTSFDTNMGWYNRTSSHTHEFGNFEAEDDIIEREPDGSLSIEGEMDVGTNLITTWPDVPAEIFIEKGKIITISLDHEETDNHFAGQPIHGVVSTLKSCSITPGPEMQVPTSC